MGVSAWRMDTKTQNSLSCRRSGFGGITRPSNPAGTKSTRKGNDWSGSRMKRASSLSPVSWVFAIRDDGAGAGEHYGNTCPREASVNEVALEQEILLHLQRRFGTRTKSRRTSMLDIRRHQPNCQGSDLHREPTPDRKSTRLNSSHLGIS